jgi:hypothetical protein
MGRKAFRFDESTMCYLMTFAQRWSMVLASEGYWDPRYHWKGKIKGHGVFGHTTWDLERVALALALEIRYLVERRSHDHRYEWKTEQQIQSI